MIFKRRFVSSCAASNPKLLWCEAILCRTHLETVADQTHVHWIKFTLSNSHNTSAQQSKTDFAYVIKFGWNEL